MVESMQKHQIALKERADQSLAECHEIRMSCVGKQSCAQASCLVQLNKLGTQDLIKD